MFDRLKIFIDNLDIRSIPQERIKELQILVDYVQSHVDRNRKANLNFICTHNSRRSQFCQIWAKTAADYHSVEVECFSGGVEVTAFNPRAVDALRRAGFKINSMQGNNPEYLVYRSEQDDDPIRAFSKHFDHPVNKADAFAAVMTCAHAKEHCPLIPGVDRSISLCFEDPKVFDGTPEERENYDQRSEQIASEMFYVFSRINRSMEMNSEKEKGMKES